METENAISRAVDILRKTPELRTQDDINELMESTKSIKLFSSLDHEEGESIHRGCCKVLVYAEYDRGDYIFHIGEAGDTFCIVIRGKVKILVPPTKKFPRSAITSSLPIFKSDNLQCVETMGPGSSFGELSLLRGMPRSASIQCAEPTIVAILKKSDYTALIGAIHEKKFNAKLNFLQSLPEFKKWAKNALSKLSYYFKYESFYRGQAVYKEGDTVDKVFVIKSGEFKFTQKHTVSYEKEQKPGEYINPRLEMALNLLKHSPNKIRKNKDLQILVKQQGEFFGLEDVINERPLRPVTCICNSLLGEVYVISDKELKKRIPNPETWGFLGTQQDAHEEWLSKRIECLKEIEKNKLQRQFTTISARKILDHAGNVRKDPYSYREIESRCASRLETSESRCPTRLETSESRCQSRLETLESRCGTRLNTEENKTSRNESKNRIITREASTRAHNASFVENNESFTKLFSNESNAKIKPSASSRYSQSTSPSKTRLCLTPELSGKILKSHAGRLGRKKYL